MFSFGNPNTDNIIDRSKNDYDQIKLGSCSNHCDDIIKTINQEIK